MVMGPRHAKEARVKRLLTDSESGGERLMASSKRHCRVSNTPCRIADASANASLCFCQLSPVMKTRENESNRAFALFARPGICHLLRDGNAFQIDRRSFAHMIYVYVIYIVS